MQLLKGDNLSPATSEGRNVISVCSSPSCELKGQLMLIRYIEAALNIKVGETSQDGRFLLKHIPCPGFCEKGPMFRINDSVFEELDPEDVQPILNTYLMLAL